MFGFLKIVVKQVNGGISDQGGRSFELRHRGPVPPERYSDAYAEALRAVFVDALPVEAYPTARPRSRHADSSQSISHPSFIHTYGLLETALSLLDHGGRGAEIVSKGTEWALQK